MQEEHFINLHKHLVVSEGDLVTKGEQLTEGQAIPQRYWKYVVLKNFKNTLLTKQEVYRLQGVEISKHVEIIKQIQKLKIVDPGDTTMLYGEEIDRPLFHANNEEAIANGGKQLELLLMKLLHKHRCTQVHLCQHHSRHYRVLTDAACRKALDDSHTHKGCVISGQKVLLVRALSQHHRARMIKLRILNSHSMMMKTLKK